MSYQASSSPGARESSAGDDFHLLWASRKALQLLVPDTELDAIGVEGSNQEEASYLDQRGDQLLAVDLSEYYGGKHFSDAHSVVLSQLKYSTRHPDEEWTAARLCEKKGKSQQNSIIGRLGQSFKRYYSEYGREMVLERLAIKLVSNRPISHQLDDALNCAKSCINTRTTKTRAAGMVKSLPTPYQDDIGRLWQASGLTSYEFIDFMRIFDVTDCGEGSRQEQHFALVEGIGNLGFGDVRTQYSKIKGLIWDRMMPESQFYPIISRDDILPALGLSSYRNAYPAQPSFKLPPKRVGRQATVELAKQICGSSSSPICLHSGGGKGKTLLAHMLRDHLPAQSVLVVFDCFGGGTYMNPADIRHTHSRAIPQIANEIAAKTGGALLLNMELSSEDMLRELMGRITTAVSLIKTANPEAMLVVVIDAADNSIRAASSRNGKSFVHDLLAQPFPVGSRLVVSCRTENMQLLNLPSHELFELGDFDPDESAKHLMLHFPSVSPRQGEEFHDLTHGTPRSQGYALGVFEEGLDAVFDALRPDGKSLDRIIGDHIHQAGRRSGSLDTVTRVCQVLIALPRPVPIEYIASLSDISAGAVESFCVDVGFGLTRGDDGTLTFRDQDFEDYLREHYYAGSEHLIEQACDLLYSRRNSDRYAAYHVASFLAKLERFYELCQVILDEDISEVVADPIERQEITLQRIQHALHTQASHNERVKTLQLLFLAADTTKADTAVRKIILDNPDLVEQFGDPLTVQRLHLSVANSDWPVPDLWRSAGILSRSDATKLQAEEYLRAAKGWLRRWNSLRKEDEYRYQITSEDIAHGAEALLRLYGVKAVNHWLSGWEPASFVYRSIGHLTSSMIDRDGGNAVGTTISKMKLGADVALPILGAFVHRSAQPPRWLIEQTVSILHRFCRRGGRPARYMLSDALTLCELAAQIGVSAESLREILPRISPPTMDHSPSFYGDDETRVDILLRHRALVANLEHDMTDLDAFLPDKLRQDTSTLPPTERNRIEDDRKEFSEAFSTLLPAYTLRAAAVLGQNPSAEIRTRFLECLSAVKRDYKIRFRHDARHIYRMMAGALADVASIVAEEPALWFRDIETSIINEINGTKHTIGFLLATKALSQPGQHAQALRLIHDIGQDLTREPDTASEQISTLIRCARIASHIDEITARSYFEQAIQAAADVDEEAYDKIECLSQLAEQTKLAAESSNPNLAYEFARFAEDCHIRMYGWDHFPWEAIVSAIANLDQASGFAIASRWDDRGVLKISKQILPVLSISLRKGYLPPQIAYAMSILAQDDWRMDGFLPLILNQAWDHEGRSSVESILTLIRNDILLNAPMDERSKRAESIIRWAFAHGLGGTEAVSSLGQLVAFLENQGRSKTEPSPDLGYEPSRQEPPWDSIIDGCAFTVTEEITAGINAIERSVQHPFEELHEFLARIKDRCHPQDYVHQLDALLNVNPEVLPLGILLEGLRDRFEVWSTHHGVRRWRDERRFEVLSRCIGYSATSKSSISYILGNFLKTYNAANDEIFGLMSPHLSSVIGIEAEGMYGVISRLIPSLTPTESDTLLKWALQRACARIADDRADGEWSPELCPPRDMVETLAQFTWRLLGHPDKRMRWLSAHAMRRMLNLGRSEVLHQLVPHASETWASVFRHKGNPFYYLSAKLWMFILLDRLAHEAPHDIGLYCPMITQEAMDLAGSHVLIHHFAQRAALGLYTNYPGLIPSDLYSKLLRVNQSAFPLAHRQGHGRRQSRPDDDLRFHFDRMDVLPYWYEPLGRVFGRTASEISRMADRWIDGVWGIRNEDVSWERKQPGRNSGYDDWGPSHGGNPPMEMLGTYAQWHALFCAAGELLQGQPVAYDEYTDDPFGEWLSRYTMASDEHWLADCRDPLPMDDFYWRLNQDNREDWKSSVTDDIFDSRIGIGNASNSGRLVVNEYSRRARSGISETVHTNSAMVTIETAPVLLRALQSTVDPFDFRIPLEDDESDTPHKGFELISWLHEEKPEWDNGFDSLDPLARKLSPTIVVPSADFVSWVNLVPSTDRKHYAQRGKHADITQFECWSDAIGNERHYGWFTSEGSRLWILAETLFAYLHHSNRCLIIRCSISRWCEKKGQEKYVPAKAKHYLIYPDGSIDSS